MTSKQIMTVDPGTLTAENAPIFGFVATPQIQAIALRLAEHWYNNTTGGYIPLRKNESPVDVPNALRDINPFTLDEIFVKPVSYKFDKGNLLFRDAVRTSEKYISMGLHPLAHAQVWYQQQKNGPPQLIDQPHWKIVKGWVQLRRPHRVEFFPMIESERERNGLVDGDIGIIAYAIEDNSLYSNMVITLLDRFNTIQEVQRKAAEISSIGSGIGIFLKDEVFRVKGRSREWRAKRRADRDLGGQVCGDPTAAELKKYAEGVGISASPDDMQIIAATPPNLPPAEQERFLQLERRSASVKAGNGDGKTFEQRVALMRGSEEEEAEDFVVTGGKASIPPRWWEDKTNQRDVREILPVGSLDEFFKFHGANNWQDFGPKMATVQDAMSAAADWAASDEVGPAGTEQAPLFDA